MNDFLRGKRQKPPRLAEMVRGHEPILAPGAYDALTARLIEQAGFPAVYMTGFGTSASLLGRPDVGLLTMSQMVDNARRIVQAVDVPVIADADTGYGNPLNVIRTVQEYELAGVSAIHMEDQVTPKKCGHMENKQVIAATEMIEKIQAAVEARRSDDFLIIARTDARAVEGLDSAVRRARAYREAGADILFIEAPQNEEEVALVARAFPGDADGAAEGPRLSDCYLPDQHAPDSRQSGSGSAGRNQGGGHAHAHLFRPHIFPRLHRDDWAA